MKTILLITAIVLFAADTLFALGNKSVYVELGGNGIAFSANFDSRFTKNENGFGFRVGIGIVPALDIGFASTSAILTIPVGVNYLVGKAPNYFEGGIGATYASGSLSVFGSEKEKGAVLHLSQAQAIAMHQWEKASRQEFLYRLLLHQEQGYSGQGFLLDINFK